MFADDIFGHIVDRAYELLGVPPLVAAEDPCLEPKSGILRGHPHISWMAKWQKSSTRQPHKTKAELREMLTEAVRNTASSGPRPKRLAKLDGVADGAAASVD